MADWGKIILGIFCLIFAYFYHQINKSFLPPDLDFNEYWGPSSLEKSTKIDESVRKFEISFSQDKVQKLIEKLSDVGPFTAPLEGVAFEYGFNSKKLAQILKYWKDDYLPRWSERQKVLNKFPQFKTKIQGLDIHFIHAKSSKAEKDVKVFPILLLHGWPSSAYDFHEMIPKFTEKWNGSIAFDVVVPSLPGFAFSDGARKPGLAPEKMAVVLTNLMLRLKYEKFYVHGGDWGGIIGGHLTTIFPENVLGFHSNFHKISTPMVFIKTFLASYFPSLFIEDKELHSWMFPQGPHLMHILQESGYFHMQATKPDTIGVALQHNPVGLAAYILEKFSTGANKAHLQDKDGGLDKTYSTDVIIDNLMVYYVSGCMNTAVRIYKENMNPQTMSMSRVPTKVPVAAAYFKHEFYPQFPFLLEEKYKNIIQVEYFDVGGHFASIEQPELLYKDIATFVVKTLQ